MESNDIEWLKCNSFNFTADPFLFQIKGINYIACEVFDYTKGKGKLKCYDLQAQEQPFFVDINKIKGHKSYPMIFEHQDKTYLVPETSDLNCLSLYQYDNHLNKFIWIKNLLEGVDCIDSNIFHKDNCWYLFTSSAITPHQQRLFTAHSLSGPFYEHPCSPIRDNIRGGRNAGKIIENDGSIYRLGQNCDGAYGKSIYVMNIDILTPEKYQESYLNEITPVKPFDEGLHTLSASNGKLIIDAKIHTYYPTNFIKKLIFKIMGKFDLERQYD
ncbi:MAG: hypothetical protein ACK5MF_17350 [Vibrio sp.]|uniref:glucosamine inositolphosphorylceramide transferase family protein n=1 Tax=Vibrio sp. TaxID=678 RepID=UPI003A852C3C